MIYSVFCNIAFLTYYSQARANKTAVQRVVFIWSVRDPGMNVAGGSEV